MNQETVFPAALDLEEAVIGAVLLERKAYQVVADIIRPESFYSGTHATIWEAIEALDRTNMPIDILTVTNWLKDAKRLDSVGGPPFISELISRIASTANLEYHARIISQKYMLRELMRIGRNIMERSKQEEDVFDLIDRAQQDIASLVGNNIKSNEKFGTQIFREFINDIKRAKERGGKLTGLPSGILELDRITSGWQPGLLYILASRPGMGKTALAKRIAKTVMEYERLPVAIYSLEMRARELAARFISEDVDKTSQDLLAGKVELEDFERINSNLDKYYGKSDRELLIIDDNPTINIHELRARAKRLKSETDFGLMIVDYLQLMSGTAKGRDNREQEISEISRTLKTLAGELDVPIIALSQLNRSVESRGGEMRPRLSDLRESGAIEQDADLVAFLYRAEYYKEQGVPYFEGVETQHINKDEYPITGIAEIMIAKHRNGALGSVPVAFKKHLTKFRNINSLEV